MLGAVELGLFSEFAENPVDAEGLAARLGLHLTSARDFFNVLEGGVDYTSVDCTTWMREAGFGNTYVEHLSGPDSMVVGIR